MIRPQPSTSTKSRILNGSEIITGGSIIMPIDISAADDDEVDHEERHEDDEADDERRAQLARA